MSEAIDKNDSTSSQSPTKEISILNALLSIVTITSLSLTDPIHAQPLPTLPLDLIAEILCWLPVKFLLQLRCVCKSWNSLICDANFAKKHLRLSTVRQLHFLSYSNRLHNYILTSHPFHSIFTNITNDFTQLELPPNNHDGDYYLVGSCNGILCLADYNEGFVILWNPSIRKSKELPPFQKPKTLRHDGMTYGFGYDPVTDNYKVVVILHYYIHDINDNYVNKIEVKIHTLGTSFWKNIQEFHFDGHTIEGPGHFVGGAINWRSLKDLGMENSCFIISFNLKNESFQEILLPDHEEIDTSDLNLGMLRDCLCMISGDDVWVMKEYGNKESWTKLFTVCHMQYPCKSYGFTKVINIFEDDQVLLEFIDDSIDDSIEGTWIWNSVVYNSKNDTFNFTKFESTPEICIESLISPCS
ncbi:putative F-box domain-containing protein [Medicago truncatula]|uniref:F-box and associated interaction domain protein n=1 Tax=Medicago truncatula TaxID=3880 RepID=A0A072V3V0_MEDTR|nr:F-box/kelch-repeat protein At3g23880 [Medicago truncatula]KEH32820.1 F-box and associated interaction domain protein [Medicago truncatula]RHN65283.1 putative F-box domain-containing protein [Medicago truncatula]